MLSPEGRFTPNPDIADVEDTRDNPDAAQDHPKAAKPLQVLGGGIYAYTPQDADFDNKYGGSNKRLALQFDNIDLDSIGEILPGLTGHKRGWWMWLFANGSRMSRTGPEMSLTC